MGTRRHGSPEMPPRGDGSVRANEQAHVFDSADPVRKPKASFSAWFPYTGKLREDGWPYWEVENNKALRRLLECTLQDTCAPNQDKVVILASFHFRGALVGWVAGEDIWAQSVITALKKLGYTYVFAYDNSHVVRLHQMFPSLVVAILMENDEQDECWKDQIHCIKSLHNPYGIPIWKILSFYFWTEPRGPLGANWTLSPEPYEMEGLKPNLFLGYSIEPICDSMAFVPHYERDDRAYIMTKRLQFLVTSDDRAWPPDFYAAASQELGIEFVLGITDESLVDKNGNELRKEDVLPKGVKNMGALNLGRFTAELSKSKVLIGVGQPHTSPTPYQALCLGVPFINPITNWDRKYPNNRYRWHVQHGILKFWDPPFVYNVYKDDKEGFISAIRSALDNPIDSHIIEHMQMTALMTRLDNILKRDLYGLARDILTRRQDGKDDGPLFIL